VGKPKLTVKQRVAIVALLPVILLVALVLVALLPVIIPYVYLYKFYLRLRFHGRWGRLGRRALLIYSRSPNWQPYIEDRWLAEIGNRLVTLDWSDRARPSWRKSLEVRIFKAWAPARNFNPMAVLFPRRGKPRVLLFREAFLAHKHGNSQALEELEAELYAFSRDGG
jgi:hypothetical protein